MFLGWFNVRLGFLKWVRVHGKVVRVHREPGFG